MGDFRYLVQERGVPGFYWGVGLVGVATTTILVVAAAAAVPIPYFLAGVALGLLAAYWWYQVRNYAELAEWKEDFFWWYGVDSLGGLAGAIFLFLLDGVVVILVAPEASAPLVLQANAVPAGWTLGSLIYVAVRPRLYKRLYGRRGRIAIAAVAVALLLIAGGTWFFGGGSRAEQTPTPTPTATVQPQTTETAWPSPTSPSPTVRPTLPPPMATVTATILTMPTPQGLATAAPTTARTATTRPRPATAPPCTYTTGANDTWTTVAQKMGVDVGALMRKNPGANPAQSGTVLNSPRPGCP